MHTHKNASLSQMLGFRRRPSLCWVLLSATLLVSFAGLPSFAWADGQSCAEEQGDQQYASVAEDADVEDNCGLPSEGAPVVQDTYDELQEAPGDVTSNDSGQDQLASDTEDGLDAASKTALSVEEGTGNGGEEPADNAVPGNEEELLVSGTKEENPSGEAAAGAELADGNADDPLKAADETDHEGLTAAAQGTGWTYEQVGDVEGWRYYDKSGVARTGWIVTKTNPLALEVGLQRYWLDVNGLVVMGRLLSLDECGRWAYARPEGYVVRGKWTDPATGLVYLADNDGRLESPGWVVTNHYDKGTMQRYWVDEETRACVPGYSTDGWQHFTTSAGYVARSAVKDGNKIRIADNDGLIADGWFVTSAIGHGLQRYWQKGGEVVMDRLLTQGECGWWAYARPEGYVVRGKWTNRATGFVYLANNDGRLESPGWVVTGVYDNGIFQRYWVDGGAHACVPGYSTDGWMHFTTSAGYVARSIVRDGGKIRIANNDGLIADGWYVTSAIGHGLQRYWQKDGEVAMDRLLTRDECGWWAYARPEGYVVREKWANPTTGLVYLANNDGCLEDPGWVVTKRYDGPIMRRYRIDETTHASKIGFFEVAGNEYLGLAGVGYVLIGEKDVDGKTYIADSDGILYPALVATTCPEGGKVTTTQLSLISEGTIYLMLPSFTNPSDIGVSASTMTMGAVALQIAQRGSSEFASVTSLDLTREGIARDANGAYCLSVRVGVSSVVRDLAVMLSNAISSIHLTSVDESQGRAYVEDSPDHSAKASVVVRMLDGEGTVVYDKDTEKKASTIKGRGNTSWGYKDKLPYQISLNKKADLLQTGDDDNAQKKWILLANASDATLLHSTVAYNLALELGLCGVECTPIDLYYDGEYRGSYLLTEKVEVKKGRVDIYDLEGAIEDANDGVDLETLPVKTATNSYGMEYSYVEGVQDPEDITGGYLLEVDEAYYMTEFCWFNTSWGHVVVKSPEFCSKDAVLYISEYFESALRLLNSSTLKESDAIFDIDSLAMTYLINEFTKNIDVFYSSTYVYKDKGSDKLVWEPLWDFDASMGVRNDYANEYKFMTYQGFVSPHVQNIEPTARVAVLDNQLVRSRVQQLWTDVVSPLVREVLLSEDANALGANGCLHSLAYYRNQIAASQRMNEVACGLTSLNEEIDPFPTYELNFNYLANWLGWRTAWIDDNIWRLDSKNVVNAPYTYNGVNYNLVFDAGYYKSLYSDLVNPTETDLIWHFCTYGMKEGRVASRNFDVRAYKRNNPDLAARYGDDWTKYYLHYMSTGFFEGRVAA
ncbi:MAG: CotH kinase family protein [Atopobiaceae bacterium]|nr:CotH kinase family protein [Atopobiaceae bacterium]